MVRQLYWTGLVMGSRLATVSAFIVPRFTQHQDFWLQLPSTTSKTTLEEGTSSFETTTTLQLPVTFAELMVLQPGGYVETDSFMVANSHNFRVKVYPRGATTQQRSSFGMSYDLPQWGRKKQQTVQVFLEYLDDIPIDVTFGLRLVGNQSKGQKFDVEWRASMRFSNTTNLRDGIARDFGSSLLQTSLLREFLGITDDNYFDKSHPIVIKVDLQLHTPPQSDHSITMDKKWLGDLRHHGNNTHDTEAVRAGKIVVPVLKSIGQRQDMFNNGVYPGVEYRVMRITDKNDTDVFYSAPSTYYHLKPIYPLVSQLERPWPVIVSEKQIPKLVTTNQYNAISAIASLATAVAGLLAAFSISQAISFFYIPSRSMEPTLNVGDVLLVEKITPILWNSYKNNDVVLFQPPQPLQNIVRNNGGRISSRDLFVKRVAAQPNDVIDVSGDGGVTINNQQRSALSCTDSPLITQYIQAYQATIPPGTHFVLGDCSSVSVDSRVWGPLEDSKIIGRPLLRLWPLSRFGALPDL